MSADSKMGEHQKQPQAPKRKPGRPKKPATADDVLRLAERLTPEEREKLRRFGAVVPEGTANLEDPSDSVWGLFCSNCNRVALRFLGTQWQGFPVPPAGTKLRDLAWTQDNCEPDRNHPNCQYCGAGPRLGTGGGILPPGPPHFGIVPLEGIEKMNAEDTAFIKGEYPELELTDHEAKIKQAYSAEERRKVRQRMASEVGDMGGSSHAYETQQTSIQDHIDRVAQTGEVGVEGTGGHQQIGPGGQPPGRAAAVMEAVAEQGGLNNAVAGGFTPLGRG